MLTRRLDSKKRAKYADLLSAIQTNEEENQYADKDGDMEITFTADMDAEKKLQEMVQRKMDGKEKTVFDELMEKERKKRQEKKQAAKEKKAQFAKRKNASASADSDEEGDETQEKSEGDGKGASIRPLRSCVQRTDLVPIVMSRHLG